MLLKTTPLSTEQRNEQSLIILTQKVEDMKDIIDQQSQEISSLKNDILSRLDMMQNAVLPFLISQTVQSSSSSKTTSQINPISPIIKKSKPKSKKSKSPDQKVKSSDTKLKLDPKSSNSPSKKSTENLNPLPKPQGAVINK